MKLSDKKSAKNISFFMNAQLQKARQKKSEKNEAKEEVSKEKRLILLQNKVDHLEKENKILKQKLNSQRNADIDEILEQNVILDDLINHAPHKNNKKIEYCAETINLSLQIQSVSPKAYELLSNYLFFPTKSYIKAKFRESLSDIPRILTDINEVGDVINLWKEKNHIPKSLEIKACLAVDAIFFKPEFKITVENAISGLQNGENDIVLPKDTFTHFSQSPSSFKTFIELNWSKIIKAGFVFQIQPYNMQYKTFVVHIFPSINGKGSQEIIDMLFKIRDLANNKRVHIKSFAFDGDNSYRQLHMNYFKSYINVLINTNKFVNLGTKIMRVTSDYYHLLKRLRYRLLSSIIHAGFAYDSDIISIDQIKDILKGIGEVVFCNEKYTKMHDQLPLELFKVENIIKLIDSENFPAVAYWFPISTSMIAMLKNGINLKIRNFLMECSLFFMIYFYQIWEKTNCDLKQRKYGDEKDVIFYTYELLIEFTNTIYSHMQLMNIIDNYNFPSNGTGPLEHKFGLARIKSHDINTLSRFIQVISAYQTIENQYQINKLIKIDEYSEKIKGRINTFGVSIKDKKQLYQNENFDDELPFSPQIVAKSILVKAGFPISSNWTIDVDEIIYWTTFFLNQFAEEDTKNIKKRKVLTLNTFSYGTDTCKRAKALITGKPVNLPNHTTISKNKKKQIFDDMCIKKLGQKPTKYRLYEIVKFIQESDETCDYYPNKKTKKSEIYDWIVDNLDRYFVIIDLYEQK